MRARLTWLAPVVALIAGCASTQTNLVNLWIDSNRAAGAPEHVLVVAMWQDHDERVLWEERFAQALNQNHTRATPSYTEMPAPMPDSTTVFTEARNHGYDGVIVIHRHVEDRNSFYLPGYTLPRASIKPRWYTFKGGTEVWTGSNAAGWSSLECDVELWSPADKAGMVWCGTGEVAYPGSDDYAAYSVAGTVVSELERLGLVPSRL
jgi:hypothetical protein